MLAADLLGHVGLFFLVYLLYHSQPEQATLVGCTGWLGAGASSGPPLYLGSIRE